MQVEKSDNFYLIKFSNGLIKVGIGNVKNRIATHKRLASIFDAHLVQEFTSHVSNPLAVEKFMIHHLGTRCSGIRAREWFKDADYDQALEYFETIKDTEAYSYQWKGQWTPERRDQLFDAMTGKVGKKPADIDEEKPFQDAKEKQITLYNKVKNNPHFIELLGDSKSKLLALSVVGVSVTDVDIDWAIESSTTTSANDALDFFSWAIVEMYQGKHDTPQDHRKRVINILGQGFEWLFA